MAFGDHILITFEISSKFKRKPEIYKRKWINYTKDKLCSKIRNVDSNIEFDDVQGYWNCFESKVVETIDELAPMELQKNKCKNAPNSGGNQKQNQKKRQASLQYLFSIDIPQLTNIIAEFVDCQLTRADRTVC